MRHVRQAVGLLIAMLLAAPAAAAPPRIDERASLDAVQRWIVGYRLKPEPARVPAAIRALSTIGALKDPEQAGLYVGFLAGVIGSNPARAEQLITRSLPLPGEDQWVIVRAIAYSGLPDWKALLNGFVDRMPSRRVMIDTYLADRLPTLAAIKRERDKPGFMDQLGDNLSIDKLTGKEKPQPKKELTLEGNPELLDTLWGFYFATGEHAPIGRIIGMLPWSKDRDSVERLTAGSTAKYTLANYAARDANLLATLKELAVKQPKDTAPVLHEVIEAAETTNLTAIHKDQLNAIEELKRKGPQYRRDASLWAQIGQGVIALGCIAAAALGQVEIGIPCVVGGALSSAGVYYMNSQQ
jgi:hypothetical protein